ncbi:MAG: peptidoglycan DD-metalloendopeptidase family protein, partial [Chitinophagales bacterium]
GNELYAKEDDKDKNKKTEQTTGTINNDGAKSVNDPKEGDEVEKKQDVRLVDGKLFVDGKEIKDPVLIKKYLGKNRGLAMRPDDVANSSQVNDLLGANLLDFKVAGDCEPETTSNATNCDIKMIDGILYKDGDVVPEGQWEEVLRISTTMEDLLDLTPKSFEEKNGSFLSEQEVGQLIQQDWRVKNDFNKQSGLSLDDAVWNMMDGELSEAQLNSIARQYEVSPSEVANHVRAIEKANNITHSTANVGAKRISDPNAWVNNTLETLQKPAEMNVAQQTTTAAVGISANYSKTTDIVPVNPSTYGGGKKILLSNVYGEDIPAFNHYHGAWDTKKIHNYKYDLSQMRDTVEFFLTHGLDDDFKMPTMGYVTSNFGPRRWRYHNGIDLKLQKGDPVLSMFEGKVRIAQYSRSYGYVVVVRHFNGLETLYAHLSKLKVKSGDKLTAGQVVGLGGSTGRSTGNHLHLEVRYKGHPINPNELINFNSKQLKHHTFTVDRSYFTSTNPYESTHGGTGVSAGGKKYHKIRRGDTLGRIAKRNGTSVKQLCRLNGISSRTTLRVGRNVRVR